MSPPDSQAFDEYLVRVRARLGDVPEGGYGKFGGRMVKRLSRDEFDERWRQYSHVKRKYDEMVLRGDTVNDALVQMIDEWSAELLIPSTLAMLFKTGDSR